MSPFFCKLDSARKHFLIERTHTTRVNHFFAIHKVILNGRQDTAVKKSPKSLCSNSWKCGREKMKPFTNCKYIRMKPNWNNFWQKVMQNSAPHLAFLDNSAYLFLRLLLCSLKCTFVLWSFFIVWCILRVVCQDYVYCNNQGSTWTW